MFFCFLLYLLKKHLCYIVLLIVFFFGCSKDKKVISSQTLDSIPVYINLVNNNNKFKQDKKIQFNQRAYELIQQRTNSTQKRRDLSLVASNFFSLGQKKLYKSLSEELIKDAEDAKDTFYISKGYKNLGEYYIDNGKNDSSFFYFLKAEKYSKLANDSVSMGEIFLDKAFIQLYESDFNGSEISAFKSLAFLPKSSNKLKIYEAYNLIGINSNELKNYDKAIEYHNKALKYIAAVNAPNKSFLTASSMNNLGYVYQTIGKHEEAIKNFNNALTIKSLKSEYPGIYAMLIDNVAYSKFKLKDYSQLPGLFYKSLRIRDSLKNDFSGIILNKIHLSEFYLQKGDSIKSKLFANQALRDSRETKVSSDILISLQQLTLIDHENAVGYSREYIRISDSLQQAERKSKDKFARLAFETDEIIMANDKLAEQNRSLLYFFVGTLLVGLLLFVIRAQRAKNRELMLMQAQQKANEEIYNLMITQQSSIEESRVREKKRIAQELHDGVLGRLFGARLNLDSLNRFTDDESISARFNYLSELKNIEQDIREISHDLNREKYVLINNFVAIINNLLEEQRSSFGVELESNIDNNVRWDAVDNVVKINLYRILQESLQNINKYAKAKNITVDLSKSGDTLILSITDDGIGFETDTKKKGIGLANIVSRSNECNGKVDIQSKKGSGTQIIVTVPYKNITKNESDLFQKALIN